MFPGSAFVERRMAMTIVYPVNVGHMSTSSTMAEILKDICLYLRTEPGLLPVNPETICFTAISSNQAIVATGLWAPIRRQVSVESAPSQLQVIAKSAPSQRKVT